MQCSATTLVAVACKPIITRWQPQKSFYYHHNRKLISSLDWAPHVETSWNLKFFIVVQNNINLCASFSFLLLENNRFLFDKTSMAPSPFQLHVSFLKVFFSLFALLWSHHQIATYRVFSDAPSATRNTLGPCRTPAAQRVGANSALQCGIERVH